MDELKTFPEHDVRRTVFTYLIFQYFLLLFLVPSVTQRYSEKKPSLVVVNLLVFNATDSLSMFLGSAGSSLYNLYSSQVNRIVLSQNIC